MQELGAHPIAIGGVDDHVHLLVGMPPTLTVSEAVRQIKGGSSKWMHESLPGFADFAWQDGYGAFTVGHSQIEATKAYIRNQREHHREKTFEEEFLAFLRRHEMNLDMRYVFD